MSIQIMISAVLLVWFMTVITFYLGAKVGLGVSKKEKLELPNPIRAVKEYQEEREKREEERVFETNMENIDNYDGTELGQRDFD